MEEASRGGRWRRRALLGSAVAGASLLGGRPSGVGRGIDGATLQARLDAGGTVTVPRGRHVVAAPRNGDAALEVRRPGTHVVFEPGAVAVLAANDHTHYSILRVSAPDVVIVGGVLVGDVEQHTGTEGEWGHGVDLTAKADRARVVGTRATHCWGDGFFVWGHCSDVLLEDCVAENNRRQGLSIIDAVRPRVHRGRFTATGRPYATLPSAGIDIEPDPDTDREVLDAVLEEVVCEGNTGAGLLVSANGRPTSVRVLGGTFTGNGGPGVRLVGPGGLVKVAGGVCSGNTEGLAIDSGAGPVTVETVLLEGNTGAGLACAAEGTVIRGAVAVANTGAGFVIGPSAGSSRLEGVISRDNATDGAPGPEIDVHAPGALLRDVLVTRSVAGDGVLLRATALRTGVEDLRAEGEVLGGGLSDLRPASARLITTGHENGADVPRPGPLR